MTKEEKEELEKEAEEKADIYFNSLEVDNGNVSDTRFSDYDVFIAYEKGALDFAEPREKRIAELEKENAELKEKWLQATDEGTSWAHLKCLERENEELRKELEEADNATDCFNRQEEIIAKAKELLHLFLDADTPLDMINAQRKAEQFLEEIKE